MQPRHRRILARIVLALFVAGGVTWLARLDYAAKISTDVLDLMPVDEREPDLVLVRQMASQQQARAALFVLSLPETAATDPEELSARLTRVAETFTRALRESPAFNEVEHLGDPTARDAIGSFVFTRRFELLLPGWLAERRAIHAVQAAGEPFDQWLAGHTAQELETFLTRPAALAFEPMLPADPLLLVPDLIDVVGGLEGADFTSGNGRHALIWARLAASPLSEAGQSPVFAAVAAAEAAAQAIAPETMLQWTSVSRFAAESRRRIQTELAALNTASLAAVLTVAVLCLRRLRQMLHLAPAVLCSLLGAWVATTAIFDRVHILVFVIGALLGGIATDYGLHIYLHRGSPNEDFAARLRAVRRPLLGSAITSLIGFSVLIAADLPLIRQLGVFVTAGLVCALGSAVLWFAQVNEPRGELRHFVTRDFSPTHLRRARWIAGLAVVLVVAGGIWRLHWRDDIRDLDVRIPALWENDRVVREHFGQSPDRSLFLARGDSPAAARAALARFTAWMSENHPDAVVASIGFALPTAEDLTALPGALAQMPDFPRALRAALEQHGFDSGSFDPFFSAWRDVIRRPAWPMFDDLVRDFHNVLRGPASMLLETQGVACWFAAAVDGPAPRELPSELSTMSASQLESLNHLFGGYRRSALRLSLIGLTLAALSVLVVYGVRHGPRMILVPATACLFAFSVLALAGQTLNLFHLLGAFLALCLSFDYAIFAGHHTTLGASSPPPSVRLSALTTMASFGVLAFSRIPVASALGVTVALIVVTAWTLVELGLFQRRPAA